LQKNDYTTIARVLRKQARKIESEDTVHPVCKAAKTAMLLEITSEFAEVMEAESGKFNRSMFFDRVYQEGITNENGEI